MQFPMAKTHVCIQLTILCFRLLKRRQIKGSEPCAIATIHILRQVVARARWHDVNQLLDKVQQVGRRLVEAQPRELVIGNIVRRVLGLIRDEADEDRTGGELADSVSDMPGTLATTKAKMETPPPQRMTRPPTLSAASSFIVPQSMFSLLSIDADSSVAGSGASTPIQLGQSGSAQALKSEVIDGIEEIQDEISQVDDQISGFADVQIHPGDHVLVYQPTKTVERFLVRAAAKRQFTVFIAGEAPSNGAAEADEMPFASLRKRLAAARVKTVKVTTSGLMAYMQTIRKVVLDAKAMLADGGVLVEGGAGLVARAAHECGATVVVVGGVYKVSPETSSNVNSLIEWGDPSALLSFADGAMVDGVDVELATTDFIHRELVDIYITNL